MWSDRLPEARMRKLVERLRGILPAPAPGSRRSRTPLRPAADPLLVAERLRGEPGFSWLDGGGAAAGNHRLHFEPLATLSAAKGRCVVTGPGGSAGFNGAGFDLLAAAFAAWQGDGGVLVGFLGYELGSELEPLPAPPPDDLGVPDLHLALYDAALVGDGRSWALEATDAWGGPARPMERVLQAERLLAEAAQLGLPEVPAGRLAAGPVASRPSRGGYEAAVRRAVERIGTGEIFQVNLCRRLEASLPTHLVWPFHRRLRAASPADHGAYFDLAAPGSPGRALLSVSPELFLSVREGQVETRPIKGTRARGATPREDRALARELAESEKDRAELTMIVDVARNDLGRVCETGSVEVLIHGEVMTLPTVHHTVSTIRGRLRPDAGIPELLRAAFPAASITGAPKIQAMKVIAGEEEVRRGPAMGAFGWMSLAGDLDLAVAIRTAVAARGRVAYHAGCGIVADSDPELEFEESVAKARAFLTALGAQEAS
jgi:para-aminobenzoate synthetase component 1